VRIETWPIERIQEYERNPRNNEAAVGPVAESIRQFGFKVPVLVDGNGVLIAGHTRIRAARQLGMTEVPVICADDLTPEQVRAFRLADNKLHELSTWDFDLLPIELAELQGTDIDLGLIGFTEDELAKLLDPGVKQGLCDPDEVPEPPDEPVTKPGDLWVLGDHRLLCGDAGNAEHVDRLLDRAKIHLVNTDPPYNVRVEPRSNNAIAAGLSSFQGPKQHQRFDVERHPEKANATHRKMRAKDRPLENDFVSDDQFNELLRAWFGNIARVLEPGRAFYIWGGYANLGNYPPVLKECGLYFSQGIVWDKEHPVLTRKDFLGCFEIAFYGWKEGAAHQFFGPNNAPDLWHVKKISPQKMEHITQKPVELAVRAIQYSSRPGENVLDLFAGSGSTLIACQQTGRKCYAMEIDPWYADVVIDRFQRFSGKRAVLADSGKPFPKAPPAKQESMR